MISERPKNIIKLDEFKGRKTTPIEYTKIDPIEASANLKSYLAKRKWNNIGTGYRLFRI